MSWESVKRRVTESAVEFALNAFWIAVWGVVATGVTAGVLFLKGASSYLLIALAAIASTLVVVLGVTAAVAFVQRQARRVSVPPRAGRKGFLDYKIQGQRALARMTASLTAMTEQTERIGRELTADARRMERAQRARRNADERGYRAMKRAAAHVDRRAALMRLHATNYASDVRLFIEGTGKWIDWVAINDMRDRNQLAQFAAILQTFQQTLDESVVSLEAFRQSIEESRSASEEMDIAGGALSDAVTMVITASREASGFCVDRVPQLLN